MLISILVAAAAEACSVDTSPSSARQVKCSDSSESRQTLNWIKRGRSVYYAYCLVQGHLCAILSC